MEKWIKKGLIYCPNGSCGWDVNSFMTPSAIMLNSETIRIYGGSRDNEGVSRIRYIDVSADNPAQILNISQKAVLDIGCDGCFDDNGVILGDVIQVNNNLYMYYVGFQKVEKVKFLAFTGLAISSDGGDTFTRYSTTPIMDRGKRSKYIRAIHSVIYDEGVFKIWYAVGDEWRFINDIPYPTYNIWYTESKDGIHIDSDDLTLCIDTQGTEYRIGRPKVYKTEQGYKMYYTRDFIPKDYVIGYAKSKNGRDWVRMDAMMELEKSISGWDSEMACYPTLLEVGEKTYMFYNGNGMGKTGVGYAELVND